MIAICDDERRDGEELAALIRETPDWKAHQFSIQLFDKPAELLEEIKKGHRFGLIFMDIYLGEERGDLIAREILDLDKETELVFQTNSLDFAIKAFELNALHYLVKPLSVEKVSEVLRRYQQKKNNLGVLELKAGRKDYLFQKENITKIISEKKGIRIYQKEEADMWIKTSFQNVADLMDDGTFLVVSRGYLVNMGYIQSIDREKCILEDGTEILLSRKNRGEIRQRYHDYLFERA